MTDFINCQTACTCGLVLSVCQCMTADDYQTAATGTIRAFFYKRSLFEFLKVSLRLILNVAQITGNAQYKLIFS